MPAMKSSFYFDAGSPGGGHVTGDKPTTEQILMQLERMIASPDFVASERNRRFLRHVVELSLRGEAPKAYEIGTIIFGRPAAFNATLDPIVRIEAGKLRRDIETYYLKSGRRDDVVIAMPRGGYRATFSFRRPEAAGITNAGQASSILRAALLGLAGRSEELPEAWTAVVAEYPDFAANTKACEVLMALHGQDDKLRKLLLEGLDYASRSARTSLTVKKVHHAYASK